MYDRYCQIKWYSTLLAFFTGCYRPGMITPAQCRAARALLDWSQQQLATAAQVGVVTVRQFEGGAVHPRPATLAVVQRAFEAAGVAFIAANGGGPGVRLQRG